MEMQKPPQIAPPPQPPTAAPRSDDAQTAYNIVADKIGGVPNFRKRDNVYQGIAIVVCLLLGTVAGAAIGGASGAGLGALTGLTGGLILSGAVLAVIGLIRKS